MLQLQSVSAILAALGSCILLASAQTPADQCFWKSVKTVKAVSSAGWFACNNTKVTPDGASLCCLNGSLCGEDSICHFEESNLPDDNPGLSWFVGGCTDGSYNDPVCPQVCTVYGETYIEYNTTESLWHCCGDYPCNSPHAPTNDTFSAIAESAWSALPATATSSTATATTSTTATSVASSTSSPTNSTSAQGSGGGLSTGAQAGIGVGVAVAALAVIFGFLFWYIRRRRATQSRGAYAVPHDASQNENNPHPDSPWPTKKEPMEDPVEASAHQDAFEGTQKLPPQELETTREPVELPE